MNQSAQLFSRARSVIPGGVNSPVRAFRNVDGDPFFVQSAKGAYITDADGRQLIDYIGTWGPAILGHAPQPVLDAVHAAVDRGLGYGIPAPAEVDMAEMITDMVPSVEKVRMVNSGTEATMSAIRLARGYTGRRKIIKFIGCYHGHVDSLLVAAGSGALTFGEPDSAGVPREMTQLTLTVPYNDREAVKKAFELHGSDIAAVILEPFPANAGLYFPQNDFLHFLREITLRHDTLLIFDEVMTGFRVAPGGVQQLYGITPDLTCMGKVIGGGLPVGAFGGRSEIMDCLSPLGPVYQAGTLSGNPVAMAAGLAQLRELLKGNAYERLEQLGARMEEGIREALKNTAEITPSTVRVPCSASSSRKRKSIIWNPRKKLPKNSSNPSSGTCWNKASTSRLPRTKRALSLQPIRKKILTARWKLSASVSPGWVDMPLI